MKMAVAAAARRISKALFLSLLLVSIGAGGFAVAQVTPERPAAPASAVALDRSSPGIQAAMAAQERHTAKLFAIPGVVGTAVGLDAQGNPSVLVFTEGGPSTIGQLPDEIEGFRVTPHVTGRLQALASTSPGTSAAGISQKSRKSRWDAPVPIGVSTGNANECSAGTLGALVATGGMSFALSNNHVYARMNAAANGEEIDQPGLVDTRCIHDVSNKIGTLYNFVPIDFDGSNNTVDAAIAQVNNDSSLRQVGCATPADGYGAPQTSARDAVLDEPVEKYGRTTGLTHGYVVGINAIVDVDYGAAGVARFVGQTTVFSSKPFIKAGDSGSLLVSDPDAEPVGLLFAGSLSGKYAFANPILLVLSAFGVSVAICP